MRGSAWTMIGYVTTQLLRTVATLVLARRFLGPETFGIVGLVGVFLAGLAMFSELGIVANIVQHPRGDDPKFLNTAFSIQATRGAVISAVAAIAAYPLSLFYNQPELFPLLIVAGLSELIRGMTSTAAWTLNRHVNLRNITLISIGSEVVAFVISIVWALLAPSAWVLVARTIASAAAYAIGSHFIARPAVRFGWEQSAAKDILRFGGWISLATATYFLGSQGERLILGKFITPAELGCFSLAIMISSIPAGGVSQLVNQIYLPMISSTVRTSHAATVRDFGRARRLFFALGIVAASGFLVLGKPFVTMFLNPKYETTGWMLQLLGLRVALDLFAAPVSSLVLAFGESRYSATANTTRLVFMITGVWVVFWQFGLRPSIVALIVAQALSYFPLIFSLGKLLPEARRAELRWYILFLTLLGIGATLPWIQA